MKLRNGRRAALVWSLVGATVKAKEPVSPIVNRQLETSVVAHSWPSTPQNVYCEAFAYHCHDGLGESFLDALIATTASSNDSSYPAALERVWQATPLKGTEKQLLKVNLAMRAYSPQCELHRGLARETLLQQGLLGMAKDAFAVVNGRVVLDLTTFDWDSVTATDAFHLLPDESVLGAPESTPRVILYANMGSPAFASIYRQLRDKQIPLVVRHLGAVGFEDDASSATGTVLQGYGVRLDIRNVEYKVFDDRSDAAQQQEQDVRLDLTQPGLPTPPFLAGVNLTALGLQDNSELRTSLWSIHDTQATQSSIIPPKWRRKDLPLQATAAIVSSVDPLWTLKEISQDLPSLANTLVNVQVPEEIKQAATAMEELPAGQPGLLYVNGRIVSLERPTFNIFELLNIIREEQLALKQMQEKLGRFLPFPALQQVQKAWTMGKSFLHGDEQPMSNKKETPVRIDVGHGWKKAVIYLNDIEKDEQYASWSRSLRQMFMHMQMGMPPSVRRNLFTILAVMDPLEDSSLTAGYNLGMQLMQSGYPARVGVLLVNPNDLEECATYLKTENPTEGTPCPVKSFINDKTKANQVGEIKVDAHVVHRLVTFAAKDLEDAPGAFSAYMEYLMGLLSDGIAAGTINSLDDLLSIHRSLYEGLQVPSASKSRDNAIKSFLAKDEDLLYGHALRFAAERGIKPGMCFLNGRPIPVDANEESVSQVFGEEQNHVFGLIMKGKITDTSPKSVYAELLKGDRVYKRSHPFLVGGGDDDHAYIDLGDSFDSVALVSSKETASSPEAVFVVDGVFELDTQLGVELASKFISIMVSLPNSVDSTNVGISYRVLPSTAEAARSPLCPLFAHASLVGGDTLKTILSEWDVSTNLEIILKKVSKSSNKARKLIESEKAKELCSSQTYLSQVLPSKNFILGNGRHFPIEGPELVSADVDLLLSTELKRAKAVTHALGPYLSLTESSDHFKIASVVSYLSLEAESSRSRKSIMSELESDEAGDIGHLHLSWNAPTDASLQVQTVAAIDPISEHAQRLSPFLLLIRDQLQLPLHLLLVPSSSGSDSMALTSYYRFVADPAGLSDPSGPKAHFSNLPTNHVLTLRTDVSEPWDVQQTAAVQDTDNLRCDVQSGCGDDAYSSSSNDGTAALSDRIHLTRVEYGLNSLLVFGQCYESKGGPPNGLQLTLVRDTELGLRGSVAQQTMEIGADGELVESEDSQPDRIRSASDYSDTLVMKNVGYWQLRSNPGVWTLSIATGSKGAAMFDMVDGDAKGGRLVLKEDSVPRNVSKTIVMKDFVNRGELLIVQRKPGVDEKTSLFFDDTEQEGSIGKVDDTIHVFSLATGHLYERFLKIMMLSVTKRTSTKVKFWLFENFLSPTFKGSAKAMAERIGCEVEFVTYKWPEWLRGQKEKQRIIWGYKILFLDVLFPLSVKKIIYVDADQVVRGDLKELWDMDLEGAPYGYTPFCSSREETLGYQFWNDGFWKSHLRGKPYHISALYVVDLDMFRRKLVGDQLRSIYQQLSADPASLSNLDQDLPNYAQHAVKIFSLPQEWLWCESWCSDESKEAAKTIDLCNNPMHKEPKVSMAKRVISGPLFKESWIELDAEVERYEQEYRQGTT